MVSNIKDNKLISDKFNAVMFSTFQGIIESFYNKNNTEEIIGNFLISNKNIRRKNDRNKL